MRRSHFLYLLPIGILFIGLLLTILFFNPKVGYETNNKYLFSQQFQEIPKLMLPVLASSLGQNNSSYHVEKNGEFFESHTESLDIKTRFGKDGVTFSRNDRSLTMNLLGYGELVPTRVSANKVEYHKGNITEWYVNSPLGVEQGFTFASSPYIRTLEGEVLLEFTVDLDDGLQAKQSEDTNSIKFINTNQNEVLLTYSGLFAYDSNGRELPSEMRLLDSRIQITVDDTNAIYPIVIDPFIEVQEIFPSDVNPMDVSWQFGGTVSISGNTALVGAIHADAFAGQAYIFERDNSTGFWSETQILTASGVGDFFGNCVHIDGDTAIVGSLNIFSALQGDAYIFERDTMTNIWTEVDNITGSTGAPSDFFGIACSIEESSGVAMVGANLAFSGEGRVYVYERDMANMWNEVQILIPNGGAPLLQFGFKLNFQGDTAAIGAPSRIDAMPVLAGEVYIYERDMLGVWNELQILTGSDSVAGDSFGVDVDFDGDNMVIGASQFDMNTGKAYIFERDSMTNMWSEVDVLTANIPVMGEFYGSNVSISGEIAIVSAALLASNNGRVFVYERDAMGMWSETQIITASNGMPGDMFGVETSIDGNQLIVGANGVDGAAGTFTGAAYLYGDDITLDVEIIGEGSGVVTSMPVGIDCGSMVNDCTEVYQYQTVVTLTALPNPGSAFLEWTGDCSGTNPTTSILMLDDSLCIAEFILADFVLNPIFPALADNINSITAQNAAPEGSVAFLWAKATGSYVVGGPTCNGLELGISNPNLLAIVSANEFAVATYIFYIPLFGDFEFQVQLQAVDIENCRVSNIVPQIIRKD
ncbi:MAG: hypothetical protein WBC96_04580 [Thermodesulfobacteriota bacterium]